MKLEGKIRRKLNPEIQSDPNFIELERIYVNFINLIGRMRGKKENEMVIEVKGNLAKAYWNLLEACEAITDILNFDEAAFLAKTYAQIDFSEANAVINMLGEASISGKE